MSGFCLRQQAKYCNFGATTSENIRDQVIEKCTDRRLKAKLLGKTELTFAKLLTIAQAHKAACGFVRQMTPAYSNSSGQMTPAYSNSSGQTLGLVGAVSGARPKEKERRKKQRQWWSKTFARRTERQACMFQMWTLCQSRKDPKCPATGKTYKLQYDEPFLLLCARVWGMTERV